MIRKYIQSEEIYKGYKLIIRMTDLSDTGTYHRSCEVYRNNELISIGKTKKEIKELIDGGYIK